LEIFSNKVTHLQCFVNLFCSPIGAHLGIPQFPHSPPSFLDLLPSLIPSLGELAANLISVRKSWEELVLGKVIHQFDKLDCINHVPKLYKLRASELFLASWKKLGTSEEFLALRTHSQISRRARDSVRSALKGVKSPSMEDSKNLFQLVLEAHPRMVVKSAPKPKAEEKDKEAEPAEAVANEVAPEEPVEEKLSPVTMDDVVHILIPAAEMEWNKFFKKIDTCQISFMELGTIFEEMKRKQIKRELSLLAATGGIVTEPSKIF
jgi:hypothetical protein